MRLYDYLPSGNGYKVRLVLAYLGTSYELIERDIIAKETRTPEFLAVNPNGRIPALEFDDGRILWESNAIIWHLAAGTDLRPTDPWLEAKALQWMCFEQYSHEPFIATVRHWIAHLGRGDNSAWAERIQERRDGGYAALDVMEGHLADKTYFVGERYSIADIALYGYTHVADEGGYELSRYPAIQRWLTRVAGQPRHVRITDKP